MNNCTFSCVRAVLLTVNRKEELVLELSRSWDGGREQLEIVFCFWWPPPNSAPQSFWWAPPNSWR
jgi:hypothetical protein